MTNGGGNGLWGRGWHAGVEGTLLWRVVYLAKGTERSVLLADLANCALAASN